MNVTFDAPELVALVQDLVNVEARIVPAERAVLVRGALNIKRDAQKLFTEQRKGGYLPHYANSISYDVGDVVGGVEAEVGPDSSKLQGGMGSAIEYGTARDAPMPHLGPALDNETPKFEAQVLSVAAGLIS
jgi:hypothetical protein